MTAARFIFGTPMGGMMTLPYLRSMLKAFRAFPGSDLTVRQGTYVQLGRKDIAYYVAKHKLADYILWVDSDMFFDTSDVDFFIKCAEKEPEAIFAAMYPASKMPQGAIWGMPNFMTQEPEYYVLHEIDNWATGFGFCWTPVSCFTNTTIPWFDMPSAEAPAPEAADPLAHDIVGEDSYFFQTAVGLHGRKVYTVALPTVGHIYTTNRIVKPMNGAYGIQEVEFGNKTDPR